LSQFVTTRETRLFFRASAVPEKATATTATSNQENDDLIPSLHTP
jgi:hypothetical protein